MSFEKSLSNHGCGRRSHVTRRHRISLMGQKTSLDCTRKSLGHLRLGIILRISSLDIGQQVGEGSTLDREFSGPVHLIGDGLAPFPIVIALWG